jgi:hypothetical protein
MQVNLMHHPDAFASLEEAFEPSRNVAYGARFLDALRQETRSWDRAVERYHTADPERGRAYREKVYQRWARAPIAGEPDSGSAGRPRILMASLAADTAAGNVRSQALAERHKLRPLSSRGYLSIRGSPSRVAVLRPSGDRQLKPIVRPPRRSHVGLVRLTSSRRAVVALAP